MCMLPFVNSIHLLMASCLFSPFYLLWMVVLWMLILWVPAFSFLGCAQKGNCWIVCWFWLSFGGTLCFLSTFLHPQEFTCTQVSVLCILNNTGYLLEGWVFFFECVCVCGLNESHPDRCDGICLWFCFQPVTAHCCCAVLPARTACPASSPQAAVSPAPAPPAACLPLGTSRRPLPIHTLLTTFYSRADETSSSLFSQYRMTLSIWKTSWHFRLKEKAPSPSALDLPLFSSGVFGPSLVSVDPSLCQLTGLLLPVFH